MANIRFCNDIITIFTPAKCHPSAQNAAMHLSPPEARNHGVNPSGTSNNEEIKPGLISM
jgi:hypothetical protein